MATSRIPAGSTTLPIPDSGDAWHRRVHRPITCTPRPVWARLGDAAHQFYNDVVAKLRADTRHVEHIQDFWSDPLTAAGSQSPDGKAAYVQVYLAGNQGESLANESVEAVQKIVASVPPPPGVKAYVTGPTALTADTHIAGDRSLKTITALTFGVIYIMLFFVYPSMVTVVAIAAATDYAIFLIGRDQEACGTGADRESAFYIMFHGTAHVILGSGLTIAGATYCLSFTRLPYFQSLGVPLAIGRSCAR